MDRERRGKNKGRGKNRNRNSRKNSRRKNGAGGKARGNSKSSRDDEDEEDDDFESRSCNQVDRSSFNSDLLEFINGEYNNATLGSNRPRSRSGAKGARLASTKMELVDWKFSQLDKDR